MSGTMFRSDLWTDTPPDKEMFIWASPNPEGGWGCGLGYWTVEDGKWANVNGPRFRNTAGLKYHPMPDPDQGGPVYVVWSHEHSAWWGPCRRGYTSALEKAGRYTREQAVGIARDAGAPWMIGKAPNEIAVRLEDAMAAQELKS